MNRCGCTVKLKDRPVVVDAVTASRIMKNSLLIHTWVIYLLMDLLNKPLSQGIGHVHVLSNQSAAVLDSVIGFKANFSTRSDSESHDKYMWTWSNNADKSQKNVYTNNTYYLIHKVFSSDSVKAGNYNMTVDIFNNSAKPFIPRLATGYNSFYLSDHLNGDLLIHQNNLHQRKKYCYSTKKPLFVTAKVQDSFSYKTEFKYSWFLNHKKLLNTSSNPKHDYEFDKPQDEVFIGANVTARLFDSNGTFFTEKHGESDFRRFLNIIDSVEELSVSAPNFLSVNSTLNLTITCKGTPTFTILISIETPSKEVQNRTLQTVTDCQVSKFYLLKELGQYSFKIIVENDVSIGTKSFIVKTVEDVPVTPANVMIPVLCALMFISVLAILAFFYQKDQQRIHVETANFDFRFWKLSRPRSASFSQSWKKLSGYCQNLITHVNSYTRRDDEDSAKAEVLLQPMKKQTNYSSVDLRNITYDAIDT